MTRPAQVAALMAVVVGVLVDRETEMRETDQAATWTAAGVSVNDETPPAWQPEASLRRSLHHPTEPEGATAL